MPRIPGKTGFFNPPRKRVVDYLILKSLAKKPMHGYEIRKYLGELTGGKWLPSFSIIYPILKDFLKNGYVTREEKKQGDRVKQVYHITPKGRKKLEELKEDMKRFILYFLNIYGDENEGHLSTFVLFSEHFKDTYEELPRDLKIKILKEVEKRLILRLEEVRQELKKLAENQDA